MVGAFILRHARRFRFQEGRLRISSGAALSVRIKQAGTLGCAGFTFFPLFISSKKRAAAIRSVHCLIVQVTRQRKAKQQGSKSNKRKAKGDS